MESQKQRTLSRSPLKSQISNLQSGVTVRLLAFLSHLHQPRLLPRRFRLFRQSRRGFLPLLNTDPPDLLRPCDYPTLPKMRILRIRRLPRPHSTPVLASAPGSFPPRSLDAVYPSRLRSHPNSSGPSINPTRLHRFRRSQILKTQQTSEIIMVHST